MTGTRIYIKIFPFYLLIFVHPDNIFTLVCSYILSVRRDRQLYRFLKLIMNTQNHPFPGNDSFIISPSHFLHDAVFRRTLQISIRSPKKHCIFSNEVLNIHSDNRRIRNIIHINRIHDGTTNLDTFELTRYIEAVETDQEAGLFFRYYRDLNQLPAYVRILYWPDLSHLVGARITFFLSEELFFTKINYEGETTAVPCTFSQLYSSDHPLIIAGRRQQIPPPPAPEIKSEPDSASENSSIAPPTFTTATPDTEEISIEFGHLDSEV